MKIWRKRQKYFDNLIKALTFASRSKKTGGGKGQKFFESLEATARKSSIYGKVMLAK